jgi:hypothetical protein
MPDVELLVSLPEIAGVFVGFGALIAVRSAGPRKPYEIAPIRGMLAIAVVTIIAALAPVTIGRYDLDDHQVLALSSVLVLLTYGGLMIMHRRSPESRATEPIWHKAMSRTSAIAEAMLYVLIVGAPLIALIVIALGLAPELEGAMYFTVVVLLLVQAAWILLDLAFIDFDRVRTDRSATAPGSAPQPDGGSDDVS